MSHSTLGTPTSPGGIPPPLQHQDKDNGVPTAQGGAPHGQQLWALTVIHLLLREHLRGKKQQKMRGEKS